MELHNLYTPTCISYRSSSFHLSIIFLSLLCLSAPSVYFPSQLSYFPFSQWPIYSSLFFTHALALHFLLTTFFWKARWSNNTLHFKPCSSLSCYYLPHRLMSPATFQAIHLKQHIVNTFPCPLISCSIVKTSLPLLMIWFGFRLGETHRFAPCLLAYSTAKGWIKISTTKAILWACV